MAENPVVHFEISGPDPAALREFYAKVFGWEIHHDEEMDYGMVHAKTDDGTGIDGGIGKNDTPWTTVYIEVPDPQAALDTAVAAGAEVIMPVTESPVVTLAIFKDPAGNGVGLVKAGAASPG